MGILATEPVLGERWLGGKGGQSCCLSDRLEVMKNLKSCCCGDTRVKAQAGQEWVRAETLKPRFQRWDSCAALAWKRHVAWEEASGVGGAQRSETWSVSWSGVLTCSEKQLRGRQMSPSLGERGDRQMA